MVPGTPISKTLIVSGGAGATDNPCEAFHYHGHVGMESKVVDLIAARIIKPTKKLETSS